MTRLCPGPPAGQVARCSGQLDPGTRLGQLAFAPVLDRRHVSAAARGRLSAVLALPRLLSATVSADHVGVQPHKRSILSAILLHFMINFTGEILALSLRELFQSALWMISALLVMRRLSTATPDGAGRSGRGESIDTISAHRRS